MIVVRGKQREEMTAEAFRALRAAYGGVTVDVGAGDARAAYRLAASDPARLVVALDAVAENMREISARAARKPEKGGRGNLLCVVAAIERPPRELAQVADEVLVTLPWGSLMRGIILAEETVIAGMVSLAAPGASVRVVLNTRIFRDPVPAEAADLPEVTPGWVLAVLAPALEARGLRITAARWMEAEEVAAVSSTWGKRLSHRTPPPSLLIGASVEA
ncbi:MAG: rRNA methyltransferase [Chloroflexi bacterium]|nr:rRNA methyltransferase [Chloroflexota bacterium]